MGSADVEAKLKDIPDKYLILIAHAIAGRINESDTYESLNQPILKPSIKSIYLLFIIQYAVLAILGIVCNVAIIVYTMYHKLYKDITHAFIVNLALCHFVQCSIVLPITLMVMLIQNWIFGQFLCFFLPLLQDIPLHVAMISHLLIAWDRMRWLGDPLRGRLPAFVCCCASWLTGMVIALPYPIYTTYLELGDYLPRLNGVGLCFVNLVDDMHEYMRGLFVIMYCGPTILLAYLYIRTARELRPPDGPFAVMMFEHRADIRNRQRNSSTSSADRPGRTDSARSYDLYSAEMDVTHEKRIQRNLGSMAAAQILCVCPLMILRLAKMVVAETYENSMHFDLTYLMFVWIAFLPTVIFPCIYASQILPRTEKERLRGYLRLSTRRLKKSQNSQEESIEQENTSTTLAAKEITSPADEKSREEKTKINVISNVQRQTLLSSTSSRLKSSTMATTTGTGTSTSITTTNTITNTKGHPIFLDSNVGGNSIPGSRKVSDSINNSCSNITSSTYFNNGTERGSIDFENASDLSTVAAIDKDSYFERKWIHSAAASGALRHKDSTQFSECGSITRNDSSSTLERDLEIIDLLERERSMDIQDMMERERRGEIISRNLSIESSSRRRLPDLGKICKSPKPVDSMIFDNSGTIVDNSNYLPPSYIPKKRLSQRSAHSTYSNSGRVKRDSLKSNEDMVGGYIGERGGGGVGGIGINEQSKMSVIENRIRRNTKGSITSSGRGSIKSREYISHNPELDFRENEFANL